MKYGVFIIAGIIGSVAGISNKDNEGSYSSVKQYAKHLSMTIIFAVVFGIFLSNIWSLSLEICFAAVVVLSYFIKKVISEFTEILDNTSDIVTGFIQDKLAMLKSTKEEETTTNEQINKKSTEQINENENVEA
jgi:hypothetical protein